MEGAANGISSSDWAKGIALSVLASVVGGASKLAIRKSWLIQDNDENDDDGSAGSANNNLLADDDDEQQRIRTIETDAASFHDEEQTDALLTDERRYCCRQQRRDPSPCSTPTWLPYFLRYCGMFGMSVLNPFCCVLAMNYASPSVLAPFSGLTLVWVIVFSEVVTREKPSVKQILACAFIVTGEVVVAIFGDHTNDEGVTVEDVIQMYKQPAFLAYFAGLVCWVALLTYWIVFSKSPMLRRFAWGTCGGSLTGAQNFLKDSLTILKDVTKQQPPAPLPWFFYLFLACAAGTAFSGLLILTACMKRYDATYSAASFVGSFVVSASIMACVHYNTFRELEGLVNYILYPLGLVVLMIGVLLLVRESAGDDDVEDSVETVDEEERGNQDDERDFGYTQVDEDSSREEAVI